MASTSFTVNDPMTVKVWAKKLTVEALKQTVVQKFIGPNGDSIVQRKDDLDKGPGDTITYGLRSQLAGQGTLGDGVLEGNEESLSITSDKLLIDQLRHAVRAAGRMSQQRVTFSMRDESYSGLTDWFTARFDASFFNQICGFTPISDVRFSGLQAVPATDAAHYLNVANGATSGTGMNNPTNSDSDVAGPTYTSNLPVNGSTTVSAAFSLEMVDRAKERARLATPAIRPVRIGGKEYYVMFLHTTQVTDLRRNPNPGQWLDFQKAAMTGGVVKDNPIFDGSIGMYNGVIFQEDSRVTPGLSSAGLVIPTVRRSVFCGAQAAQIGFAQNGSPNKFTWVEKLFDFENQFGVAAGVIYGLKKTTFQGQDFATIVCSSYAVPH